MKNEKNTKRAFTLVEVLLVLVIVGIIAAFVIPLLITQSHKAQFVSALQKANNTFTNVVNHAQANVKMENWNYNTTTEAFVKEYILPYLNIAKDCGMDEEGCFAEEYKANNTGETDFSEYYKVALTDGTAMAIKLIPGCSEDSPSECVSLVVDINSINKPNTWGKDVFQYQILNGLNAVVPYGSLTYDDTNKKWEVSEGTEVNAKCQNSDEKYCALKIINEGWEMNY